ncbi:MAG: bifunctional methylenetetrahydrofolate dehydrogenase/methenyltetrahydrofolate cyclohydrolase FolD [Parachlamydiaceae bacterium]
MIIDGKRIASEIQQEIKQELTQMPGRRPCLAVVLVGDHPASLLYVERKTMACAEVGILSIKKHLPANLSESDLIAEIEKLNNNDAIDGILLQLPLPPHVNPIKVIHHIIPEKDVDGLHPTNIGKLFIGDPNTFAPCTPLGIKVLLERSNIEVGGKHALVIGRSNLVGKPMAALLMQNTPGGNATVTIAHSRTTNLPTLCRMADIIIAAMGQPRFLTADMIKDGAVVIDVGTNKIEDKSRSSGYRIVGDVDFDNVHPKCSYISPVPGGVGPMTIAMLLSNTLKAMRARRLGR